MARRWRFILFLLLAFVILSQTVLDRKNQNDRKWVTDGFVVRAFRPVGQVVTGVTGKISHTFNKYFVLVDVEEKNKKLKNEVEKLKVENFTLKEQLGSVKESQKVAELYPFTADALLPAQILSYDLFFSSKTVLIDKGQTDGVKVNNMILVGDGLVGRVLQVYRTSSKVLLLIDPHFAVDAANVRSSLRVLVSGMSEKQLSGIRQPFLTQVEYLENTKEMLEKDVLVTSGLGGIFPKGIPIGTVDKVAYSNKNLFDKAWVLPAVDFTKLARVFVVLGDNAIKKVKLEKR